MKMKVAVLEGYHKADIHLQLREVEVPEIGENEVLLKVLTAGVNPLDHMPTRGEVRAILPCRFPMLAGNEVVGVVQRAGAAVRDLEIGERVYGRLPLDQTGAFAQYAAVRADALARVPAYLSDEQAAAVPLTALTATEALEILQARRGETIFISGGTGGFGQMAIPLAVSRGLVVITNGNGANEQRMREMGVTRFIDDKKEDYAAVLGGVDLAIDTLGGEETFKTMGILREGGRLVSLRAMPDGRFAARMGMGIFKRLLFSAVGAKYDRQAKRRGVTYDFLFVRPNGRSLREVSAILEKNHVVPAIDQVFSLEEVNAALDKVAGGHARGKRVLRIG